MLDDKDAYVAPGTIHLRYLLVVVLLIALAITAAVTNAHGQPRPNATNPDDWVARIDITTEDIMGYVQTDESFASERTCLAYVQSKDFLARIALLRAELKKNHGEYELTNLRCEPRGRNA